MGASHSQKTAVAARVDALPLRSLTPVWIALAVFALGLGAVVVRGVLTKSAAKARASAPATAAGPTKRQVRERQEHIALTERALDLARKERKAAADKAPSTTDPAAAAAPAREGGPAPLASAPAAPANGKSAPAPAVSSDGPAPAESAAPKPAAPKPAASGLDAMRADIAAQFE